MFDALLASRITLLRREVERLESLEGVSSGGGGGGGDFALLGSHFVASSVETGSLQVSSIPQTHKHLWILGVGRKTNAVLGVTEGLLIINGAQNLEDTSKRIQWSGAARSAPTNRPGMVAGQVVGNNGTYDTTWSILWALIADYTNSSFYKSCYTYGYGLAGAGNLVRGMIGGGYFQDTAAVTQVNWQSFIGGFWELGSHLLVYGMA
jgi:hypothetical protein